MLRWDQNGVPHSLQFDDQYFCKDNGYAEGFHVCCQGNNLPERFPSLDPSFPGTFTIIETGFGTGLDFCCACELWDKCAPKSWTLRFISVELYPLAVPDIIRALDLWPSLGPYARELAAQYEVVPSGAGDWHLHGGRIHLTILFDDVVAALERIKRDGLAGRGADAWFIDGFAPSKNPDMWSIRVFNAMAQLSKPGTTLSTFTVAGFVRRGLEASGFSVKKIPGHGKKTHILSGIFAPAPDLSPGLL